LGTDAGAETGPYGTLTDAPGSRPRQAVAEELFAAHYPKLAGWVRRLVDDDETAHEIASEAFVRLLAKWTSPDKFESPQSYLYMIAMNLVRDHWRKMERERRAYTKATAGSDLEPFSDPSQDVDVRALLSALPDRLREPFLLHYYAGFSVHEIAVQLKKPDGTIKADLFHARAKLKEILAQRSGAYPIIPPQGETAGRRDRSSGAGRARAGHEGASQVDAGQSSGRPSSAGQVDAGQSSPGQVDAGQSSPGQSSPGQGSGEQGSAGQSSGDQSRGGKRRGRGGTDAG
jgi:RNA polymerase sigma-70 factor, ECF subfamily